MSQGQPDQNKGLVPLRPNQILSTEEYAANQRKIAQIRQLAASLEQSNDEAHQRFVQLELQRRVEEGERAREMLATLSQAKSSTAMSLNPEPFVAGLATGQTGYQEAQSQLHIIPSTARIEEISSSNSPQAPQHVGGPSTIPVSANTSTGWIDMSRGNLQTSNVRSYGGQARDPSSSNFGGVMQGRWQTNQPPVQQQPHIRQQQQPPAQAQGQQRRHEPQQLSQQQQQQLQAMLMRQSQPQRQQQPQQPQQSQQPQRSQQRYAQPQTISYGQTSTTVPYSSQPLLRGHMYSGQGSTRPQVVITPASNTSSLEGALGNQSSRASSSSSHRATPVSSVQPNASLQNTAQGQQANTQKRQSMDKDAIAADVIQRMGPNYISNMVATAQADSSATVPKPPTRENRAVAAAVSQSLPSSSSASQPRKAESLVNLEPRTATSPAQVLSNTRHIVAQRPTASAPAPAPPTRSVPSATPARLHARQAKSNTPPVQPLVSNGASSIAGYGPTTASTAPFPVWPPPSTSSTQPSSSVFQSTTSAQPQFAIPTNWGLYAPPGNESRSGYQPVPPGSWVSQRKVPITMAPSNSDGQGLAAGAPMTPTNQQLQTDSSPRTPASADKKHLARDILRSLGGSRLLNGKRKRSEEPPVAAKRTRPLGVEQPDSDIHTGGNFALSDQQPAGDVLPIHTSALRREEEEDDDEIELVEDMTSFPPLPISGSSRSSESQAAPMPSSTQLQLDDIIDISDDETKNLPAKPIKSMPIVAPAPSLFPAASMVSSKAKEPLFLPSPSSSPRSTRSLQYLDNGALTREDHDDEIEAPWDMPSMDISAEQPFSLESKKIRMEPYVYIPPPPDWVKRAMQRSDKVQNSQQKNRQLKHNNAKRKAWIMEDDEVVGDSEHEMDEIEGWDGGISQRARGLDTKEADEQRRQTEATEREAMSLTSSLLRKQPCKWRNCNVIMNTIDKLSQHVALHGQNKPGPYICLWDNCVRRFSDRGRLLAHLDVHVRIPVPCPYQDCDLTYKSPKGLVTHYLSEHDGDTRRPSSMPFKPTLLDMPPVPLKLPSYMVVPRDIRQTQISKERHALLGPWVLRNIFGPVSLEVKRPNAAVPLRSVRGQIDREDSTLQTIANDEYDFLRPKSPSSTPKVRFDDLPSAAVSRLVHGGLVLWGPEVDVKEEPDLLDVEPFNSPRHGDPAMADGDYQASSALAETLTERPESLSVPDAETDDRLTAIDRRPDQQDELEGCAKPADDASCLVA